MPWLKEEEDQAVAELFSQSARLFRAVEEGKRELDGAGDAKLFHNSVTGLSWFQFPYENNSPSLRSDIVDVASCCDLKLSGQSCRWIDPSGSRHHLVIASKDLCVRFNEVFNEVKSLSRRAG